MKFKVVKVQTALFIRGLEIAGYDKHLVTAELKDAAGRIFDAEPIVLPFPPDAPVNIPRIILKSKSGVFSCNIASSRVDIFRNKTQDSREQLEDVLADQKATVIKIFDYLKEKNVVVNRIGFIVTSITKTEGKTAPKYLRETFLVPNKLKDARELQIIYNKRAKNKNIEFNHLITLTSKLSSKLGFQVDINTIPEIVATTNFNEKDLISIFDYVIPKIIEIINEFPKLKI